MTFTRLAATTVLLLALILSVGCSSSVRLIGVPAYHRYPNVWQEMGKAWPYVAFVIMNPYHGPGGKRDPNYAPPTGLLNCDKYGDLPKTGGDWAHYDYLLKCMQQGGPGPGPLVYGYVKTEQGNRSLDKVKADITQYYDDYPVHGIFLDQLPQTAPTTYLEEIRWFVRFTAWCKETKGISEFSQDCYSESEYYRSEAQSMFRWDTNREEDPYRVRTGNVICNPGRTNDESYMDYCDKLVDFEGYYKRKVEGLTRYVDYTQPPWVKAYPSARFWHIVHHVSRPKDMRAAVAESRKHHVFWIYIDADNSWSDLPYYWDELMQEIEQP